LFPVVEKTFRNFRVVDDDGIVRLCTQSGGGPIG